MLGGGKQEGAAYVEMEEEQGEAEADASPAPVVVINRKLNKESLASANDDFCLADPFIASQTARRSYVVNGPITLGTSRVGYNGRGPGSIHTSAQKPWFPWRWWLNDACTLLNVEVVEATPLLTMQVGVKGYRDHGWGNWNAELCVVRANRMGSETLEHCESLEPAIQEFRRTKEPQDITFRFALRDLHGGEILRLHFLSHASGVWNELASLEVEVVDEAEVTTPTSRVEAVYLQALSGYAVLPSEEDPGDFFRVKLGPSNGKVDQIFELLGEGRGRPAIWWATFGDAAVINLSALVLCLLMPLLCEVSAGYILFAFLVDTLLSDEIEAINFLYPDSVPVTNEALLVGSHGGLVHLKTVRYRAQVSYLEQLEANYDAADLRPIKREQALYTNLSTAIQIASVLGEFIYEFLGSDALQSGLSNTAISFISALPVCLAIFVLVVATYRLVGVLTEDLGTVRALRLSAAPPGWTSQPLLYSGVAAAWSREPDPNHITVLADGYVVERALIRHCMVSILLLRAGKGICLAKSMLCLPFLFCAKERDQQTPSIRGELVRNLLGERQQRTKADPQFTMATMRWLCAALHTPSSRLGPRRLVPGASGAKGEFVFESWDSSVQRAAVAIPPADVPQMRAPAVVRALLADAYRVVSCVAADPSAGEGLCQQLALVTQCVLARRPNQSPLRHPFFLGGTAALAAVLEACEQLLAPRAHAAPARASPPQPAWVATSSKGGHHPDHPPGHAIDGSDDTHFEAAAEDEGAALLLDLGAVVRLGGARIVWLEGCDALHLADPTPHPHVVEGSKDGKRWDRLAGRADEVRLGARTTCHDFPPNTACRHVRVVATAPCKLAIGHVELLPPSLPRPSPVQALAVLARNLELLRAFVDLRCDEALLQHSLAPLFLNIPPWSKSVVGTSANARARLVPLDDLGLGEEVRALLFHGDERLEGTLSQDPLNPLLVSLSYTPQPGPDGNGGGGGGGGGRSRVAGGNAREELPVVVDAKFAVDGHVVIVDESAAPAPLKAHVVPVARGDGVDEPLFMTGQARHARRLLFVLKAAKLDGDVDPDPLALELQRCLLHNAPFESQALFSTGGVVLECVDLASQPPQLLIVVLNLEEAWHAALGSRAQFRPRDLSVRLDPELWPEGHNNDLVGDVSAIMFEVVGNCVNGSPQTANRMAHDVGEHRRDKGKCIVVSPVARTVRVMDDEPSAVLRNGLRAALENNPGEELLLG